MRFISDFNLSNGDAVLQFDKFAGWFIQHFKNKESIESRLQLKDGINWYEIVDVQSHFNTVTKPKSRRGHDITVLDIIQKGLKTECNFLMGKYFGWGWQYISNETYVTYCLVITNIQGDILSVRVDYDPLRNICKNGGIAYDGKRETFRTLVSNLLDIEKDNIGNWFDVSQDHVYAAEDAYFKDILPWQTFEEYAIETHKKTQNSTAICSYLLQWACKNNSKYDYSNPVVAYCNGRLPHLYEAAMNVCHGRDVLKADEANNPS